MSSIKLFQPIEFGDVTLQHRVVMSPLSRFRANAAHVNGDLSRQYYEQRASVPGTLIISEGTLISAKAGGSPNAPGIWSEDQIIHWKKIVDAVHAKGSFIYLQLWALGRAAYPAALVAEDPSFPYVSSGNVKLDDREETPRALTIPEIKEYVEMYATAAANSVHKAGFDGVEIHGANGFLPDQFLQTTANNRTDEYGGSIENRIRFTLEVVDAVVKAVGGAQRVGLRLSPWSSYQGMYMKDPNPSFAALITAIKRKHPTFGYLHVIHARVDGAAIREIKPEENDDFLRQIWGDKIYLSCGGYTREDAIETADKKGGLVVFGRSFISNPDLPLRLKKNYALAQPDYTTLYTAESPKGYIDYPFYSEIEPETTTVSASGVTVKA
ncbi:hypothetical protein HETIRDRAFT_390687 [Heterobasidion irregulare TC 32-1]|uniref:NADH:flavin oxidoreductase/NADH oxidase N-terminal domain-containing protein n=1 Tax=Heterobasidion irregulare (strain TC 32-1) TaxID=747525 RepID=W4JQF8_HETIT|nr:uncharacterized protein HETIRDRAFT_390687 [Heterobasidion irregulare TC 32-1]ETW75121.1 hypothetical protein HETIRDRAFT_390687 [Heterobasidion irregulare TC 32-1]